MKALIILLLPALMLIGCGQMQTNGGSAGDLASQMNANGNLDNEDLDNLNEQQRNENVEISQTQPNSLMMKVGGAELLIDFVGQLSQNSQQIAMIINGIEISQQLASDPQSFQALIASLVTAQLEKVDIKGVPAAQLVQIGLNLVKGDTGKKELSQLFGTLVKGALNMYLSKTPFSELFGSIINPIVNPVEGGQTTSPQPNNPVNNTPSSPLRTIIGTIGGAISGSNPLLGGLLNLILNLSK